MMMENKSAKHESIFDKVAKELRKKTGVIPIEDTTKEEDATKERKKENIAIRRKAAIIFFKAEKKATETIEHTKRIIEAEHKKALESLVWDSPFEAYGRMHNGYAVGFAEQYIKDVFGQLNNVRIFLSENGTNHKSIDECVSKYISKDGKERSARTFLHNMALALIGHYKFKVKYQHGTKVQRAICDKIYENALRFAMDSFKSRNMYVPSKEINAVCKEGGLAENAIKLTIDEVSELFMQRFAKIYARHPAAVDAFNRVMHSEKIAYLVSVLEAQSGLKGYVSKFIKSANNTKITPVE